MNTNVKKQIKKILGKLEDFFLEYAEEEYQEDSIALEVTPHGTYLGNELNCFLTREEYMILRERYKKDQVDLRFYWDKKTFMKLIIGNGSEYDFVKYLEDSKTLHVIQGKIESKIIQNEIEYDEFEFLEEKNTFEMYLKDMHKYSVKFKIKENKEEENVIKVNFPKYFNWQEY